MSYTIEYNRVLYEREDGKIVWIYRIGDNNVTELDGTPAKDWKFAGMYSKEEFIKRICEIAGECEGGSLQFQSNSTTPEDYLARYRKIKPKPFVNLFVDFHHIQGVLYFDEKHPPSESFIGELQSKSFVTYASRLILDIKTPQDFDTWYSYFDMAYNPSKTELLEKLAKIAPLNLNPKFWINGIGFTKLDKSSLSNEEITLPLKEFFENDLRSLYYKIAPRQERYWAYMYLNQERVRVR